MEADKIDLIYQKDCAGIDWERIPQLLKEGGMSCVTPDLHQKSFENSHSVIFVLDNKELIGCGRMLSDGVRQSAIYDIVVDNKYQGKRVGRQIMKELMKNTPLCNFILYASPGKEGFYRTLGFKRTATGMILFANPERMTDRSFIVED